MIDQRTSVTSARGYAALYYPWIVINDPMSLTGNDKVLVPPSGHLGGIYSRSDAQRGVHKAPANEFITGAVDLERNLSDGDQGQINLEGINALRLFPGGPPIVWVSARCPRGPAPLALRQRTPAVLLRRGIDPQGLRWAVFEPNTPGLWKALGRSITEFLTRVWRRRAVRADRQAGVLRQDR